jgi:hypothetical protein
MPRLAQDVHMQAEIRISTVAGVERHDTFGSTLHPIEKTHRYGATVAISEALLESNSYVPKEVIVREVSRRLAADLAKSLEAQVSALFDSLYMNAEKKAVKAPQKTVTSGSLIGTFNAASGILGQNAMQSYAASRQGMDGTVDPRSEAPEDEEWSPE